MLKVILAILNVKQLIFAVLLHDNWQWWHFTTLSCLSQLRDLVFGLLEKNTRTKKVMLWIWDKASCELYLGFNNGLLIVPDYAQRKRAEIQAGSKFVFLIKKIIRLFAVVVTSLTDNKCALMLTWCMTDSKWQLLFWWHPLWGVRKGPSSKTR